MVDVKLLWDVTSIVPSTAQPRTLITTINRTPLQNAFIGLSLS